ncbi:hypothetical protein [Pseudomonas syringae]|uniref:hypothetical protein n=1 Tax=Pseudomonas syringae TaxID=317 RepID=UPI000A241668|nr:hypothetical protein [Pseudomonas syringae]OSR78029.1 hypothetical protein BV327_01158 [Pseudomonas syringae pv. actinidiae]
MQADLSHPGKIIFRIEREELRQGYSLHEVMYSARHMGENLHNYVLALLNMANGAPPTTAQSHTKILKAICFYATNENVILPTVANDWQQFIFNYFEYYLTNTEYSSQTLKSRQNQWPMTLIYFDQLKSLKVIPNTVKYPRAKNKKLLSSAEKKKEYVIGDSYHILENSKRKHVRSVTYLADTSYTLDSPTYFEKLEERLKEKSEQVQVCANEYLENLHQCQEIGKKLIEKYDISEIKNLVESRKVFRTDFPSHIADPRFFDGFEIMLATISYYFKNTNLIKRLNFNTLNKLPLLAGLFRNNDVREFLKKKLRKVIGDKSPRGIGTIELLTRLLGFLSARDCSAAMLVLLHEHPAFTSNSLAQAKLLNKRGYRLILSLVGKKADIYSIEKLRANKRIKEILKPNSRKVIELIESSTIDLRTKLRDEGNKNYRYLFLVMTTHGYGPPNNLGLIINKSSLNFYDCYEEFLQQNEIPRRGFTYSSVRNTSGLLEGFRFHSAKAMAKKLGNTERIVLNHYVAPWMVDMWNEHATRNFQQILVVLAAHNSPWLLRVSDFENQSDLLKYIAKIITENKIGDPVSDQIQARFGTKKSLHENEDKALLNEKLLICLSAESLAMLYAYLEWASKTLTTEQQQCVDSDSGISPNALINLANLLQTAATILPLSAVEHSIRSNVQGDSHRRFKQTHQIAVQLASKLTIPFENIKVGVGK